MTRIRATLSTLVLLLGAISRPLMAQVQVGVELTRERATYHFENPSNFDTAFLVPHFFEQSYVLDNAWLNAAAAYRAGVDWETSFGVTVTRQAHASDYDTFFNPGGITWIAGTTGDARIRSWRAGQQVRIGRAGPVVFTGGYRLRVDSADFLDGDRTEVRNGVLIDRMLATTREHTSAQRHELYVGARVARPLSPRWLIAGRGEVAPAAVHRLSIDLPDKYPGVTLVFQTTALTTQGQIELRRDGSGWPLAVFVRGAATVNYHDDQRVSRQAVGAGVTLGRRW